MQENIATRKPKPKAKGLVKPKLIAGFASRKVALDSLLQTEKKGTFANVVMAAAFKKQELSERDRAFVTALVQGIMRHKMELDEKIDELSERPGAKIDNVIRNILRIGAFQLLHMPNIPQQAVLNTSTELAKICGHVGVGKFTNGLLRNLARRASASAASGNAEVVESNNSDGDDSSKGNTAAGAAAEQAGAIQKGQITEPTKSGKNRKKKLKEKQRHQVPAESVREKSLAERYSMPAWLVERWVYNYGETETVKLLQYAQQPPVLSIRTSELSITTEGLQQIFEGKGLACKRGELVSSCLILERGRTSVSAPGTSKTSESTSRKSAASFRGSPEKLTGYAEGLFSIQDEAAAFVSIVLDPKPTEFVIDLCAAPGGKSLHIAELMENRGRVVAVDLSASRLSPLKQSRTRLGLKNLEIISHDGRSFYTPVLADRILIDAPCMGTGVINRRADLRFNRQPEDLASLVELQRELLTNASKLIKPGGVLVYSTCSIEPEENFVNAQWFLDNFEQFEPEDISKYLPAKILQECAPISEGPACKTPAEQTCLHMVQLLPSKHNVSGFFVSKFRKKL